MTINVDPSNECFNWTQMPKAMQFHATEIQMSQEFLWIGNEHADLEVVVLHNSNQRLKKQASEATPVSKISIKAETGYLSYHVVE